MLGEVKGIKLSFETKDSISTWESPYADATMEDMLEGFFGMCIAHGWQPATVIFNMWEFARKREFMVPKEEDED